MFRDSRWLSWLHQQFSGRPRALQAAIITLAVLLVALTGSFVWFAFDITTGLPDKKPIRGLGEMAQATTIYDASDHPAFTIYKEQRLEVPLDKVSPNLIKAVVSVEDQRFYEHGGVDVIRIAAAVLRNLERAVAPKAAAPSRSSSPAKASSPATRRSAGSCKEVILAAHIEREYTKNEILELYLNKVYFGDGLYGVEAASRGYFGKPASDLRVDEAALLAGLIQSPSSFAPTVNLDRAVARRNVVLQTMVAPARSIRRSSSERARRRWRSPTGSR